MDLVTAILEHFASRPPLGRVALDAGMLTMRQVFQVLNAQADRFRPFGEAAVDLGLLTQEQLGALLLRQAEMATSLRTLLIEMGALTAEQFEQEARRLRSSAATPKGRRRREGRSKSKKDVQVTQVP